VRARPARRRSAARAALPPGGGDAGRCPARTPAGGRPARGRRAGVPRRRGSLRSEEHTSELQSLTNLVCRLLLEKKKTNIPRETTERSTLPPWVAATASTMTSNVGARRRGSAQREFR